MKKPSRFSREAGARPRESARMPGELTVVVVFFLSGAAGLVFEVVWLRRCELVFGSSTWATSIVLASFMGGLAAGNALVARFGHTVRRFLLTYAILETMVAATGVALTYGLPKLAPLVAPVIRQIVDVGWVTNLVRFASAFTLLVVPATAMGATLPVLVGALGGRSERFGRILGRLYGWNTLGAVVGVVGAELVLIGRFGVIGSAWVAGLLNLGAAAAALWLSRSIREVQRAPVLQAPWTGIPLALTWRLLACAFLTGATLMALEIVWFRFLSMFVITTTLTISLMLAVVLVAIGIGGLAASNWLRRTPHAAEYLPAIAMAAACASVGSFMTFRLLTAGTQITEWYRILWLAGSLTFAASAGSGMMFTLLGDVLKRHIAVEAEAAGWLVLANTLGAMCGPLVAAFVLVPALGLERAVFALGLVYGVIGLLAVRDTARSRPAKRAVVVLTALTALVFASFPFGVMAATYFPRSAAAWTADGSAVIATREGPSETILLLQKAWHERPMYHRLVTNGFSMSSTLPAAKRYMRYFAYWPMLLRQTPLRRVLVVCYGVGVTAAAVTDMASVESIDVVEISRDVTDMSDFVYGTHDHPLRDPRVQLEIEDGRYFLQTTGERFDLITGEPPPPLAATTVNLYTREYFQLIHDRLSEGGMTTYWLPAARRNEYNVKAIVRAFCDVFDDCSLWNGTIFDWMLVGTRHALGPISDVQVRSQWSDPVIGSRLREIGFELPEQIGATFLGDAAYLRDLTRDTLPLTDDYPQRLTALSARLSLSSVPNTVDQAAIAFVRSVVDHQRARQAFATSDYVRRLWPATLARETLPFFEHQGAINRIMWEGGNSLRHIEELHHLLTETVLRTLPLWELGSDETQQATIGDEANDGSGMVEYVRGLRALADREYAPAAASFAEAERRGFGGARVRPLLVYALCLSGQLDAARALSREEKPRDADELHFWTWLGSRFGVGPRA